MAVVAITSTGVGELLIKYTESSVEKSLRVSTPIAGLYLDNANTGFKYKIISGTPTAPTGSGITFTQITSAYKKLVWDSPFFTDTCYVPVANIYIGALIIGSNTYDFEKNVSLTFGGMAKQVADEIYKLNNPNVTPTSYKNEQETKTENANTFTITKSSLVINMEDLTADVYLKIINLSNNVEYLVKGVTETASNGIPTGFTPTTDPCGVSIPL